MKYLNHYERAIFERNSSVLDLDMLIWTQFYQIKLPNHFKKFI